MLMVSQSNSFIRKGSEYEYIINKYNKFKSELLAAGNFEEEINSDDYRYEISDLKETILINGIEVTISSPNHKKMKITILKDENKYILERIISAEK